MEILNIGPLELIIILLIMFVLLGPQEMIATAQRIGKWVREFVHSPMWKEVMGYTKEIRDLPKMIMDETGLQETLDEVRKTTQQTADELNAQIKEATEAARVPEIEHLKIDPAKDTEPIHKDAAKEPSQASNAASDTAETTSTPITEEGVVATSGEVATSEEVVTSGEVAASEPVLTESVAAADAPSGAVVVDQTPVSADVKLDGVEQKDGSALSETAAVVAVAEDLPVSGDLPVALDLPTSLPEEPAVKPVEPVVVPLSTESTTAVDEPAPVKKTRRKKTEPTAAAETPADVSEPVVKKPRRKKAEAVASAPESIPTNGKNAHSNEETLEVKSSADGSGEEQQA
jgi:Sec-independent protein translocase protein TatA